MTMEIGVVFAILGTAMLLFITGWIRADIVAILVLVALAATGVLEVEEVLQGFSSEAVIAIAGLLILSAGLVRSGVVRWIAERLNDIAGGYCPDHCSCRLYLGLGATPVAGRKRKGRRGKPGRSHRFNADIPAGRSSMGGLAPERDSAWVGKTMPEIAIVSGHGLTVLAAVRHDEPQLLNREDFVLEQDDMLLVSGRRTRVDKLVQKHPGLKLLGHPSQPEKFPSSSGELIEVVVPPRSPVVGKTMAD